MLYRSGPNDILKDLKEQERVGGDFSNHVRQFAMLDLELCKKHPNHAQQGPPYIPMYLVNQPPFDTLYASVTLNEVSGFSLEERKKIRLTLEHNSDIPTHLATVDVLEEFRAYASGIKTNLNSHIYQTESKTFNTSFKQKSLLERLASPLAGVSN